MVPDWRFRESFWPLLAELRRRQEVWGFPDDSADPAFTLRPFPNALCQDGAGIPDEVYRVYEAYPYSRPVFGSLELCPDWAWFTRGFYSVSSHPESFYFSVWPYCFESSEVEWNCIDNELLGIVDVELHAASMLYFLDVSSLDEERGLLGFHENIQCGPYNVGWAPEGLTGSLNLKVIEELRTGSYVPSKLYFDFLDHCLPGWRTQEVEEITPRWVDGWVPATPPDEPMYPDGRTWRRDEDVC
jgi:hypothetical protein